ncbi:NmrA family transcriptional regulator [Nitratireductor sp. ZSWI3]|uniref:NmrA family transcriptional regulator n=1 Tax=Nitratireductor sp. ZSWI3 TaxID=2966359 RepID=UPI0021504950|nr:NmrA family transcriptional regulator [Nitratireductor sp. ZSWI3]MCR4265600.1 NmrA family transcriptional regulator [Nitratireductor sp. ZSWI3]
MASQKKQTQKPILVTGGTGKSGRRLAARLSAAGIPVRIGSRSAEIPFDWENPATWDAVLDGVCAAYLSYFPDLALPGAAETVEAFARLAVGKGIKRLVLLSGRGEDGAEEAERLLRDTGAEWTILRASWFFQNFSEAFLVDAIHRGEIALPVGDVREPFIDAEDIADVAFAVLTQDGHAGELYELTGPRLMSFADAVAEISEAADRDIQFVRISTGDFTADMHAQRLPQPFIELLLELFTQVLDGRNESLADGVERVLGRPPRDFWAYADETAATGVWSGERAAIAS